jgi:hypothetical protein
MDTKLPIQKLKDAARLYAERQKETGAVTSPMITVDSPGVVLKQAQDIASELRRSA